MVRIFKNGKQIIHYNIPKDVLTESHCSECKISFNTNQHRPAIDSCEHLKCLACVINKNKVKCQQCVQATSIPELRASEKGKVQSSCSTTTPGNALVPGSGKLYGRKVQKLSNENKESVVPNKQGATSTISPDRAYFYGRRCNICGMRFSERILLNEHFLTHANDQGTRMVTRIIGEEEEKEPEPELIIARLKSFHRSLVKSKSSKLKDKPLPFRCRICNKRFALFVRLLFHKKLHNLHIPLVEHVANEDDGPQ